LGPETTVQTLTVREDKTRRRAAVGILTMTLLLSACAGENLFSLAAVAGALGPEVLITVPGEGFTIAVGDSIQVSAEVTAPDGATSATYSGEYETSRTAAYAPEAETLGGVGFIRLNNRLLAADGQVTGTVVIVVEVTDQAGAVGKDSVKVTIN